ncbi:MAG: LacI family transcriptional regulator [Lentisphaerae bacterium]|nr:LacI family transcriptional regulator [Lentisphaerota bacterium]
MTMTEFAKLLGYSQSTVSRVLNNCDRNRVRPEIAEKIRQEAKRLNFRPNHGAAYLKRGKSPVILCFLPSSCDTLAAELMSGISEAAAEKRFPVNFFIEKDSSAFAAFIREAENNSHAGIISYPPQKIHGEAKETLRRYLANGGKVLFLNVNSNTLTAQLPPEFSSGVQLDIDDYAGGKLAAQYLQNEGCRSFYYFQRYFNIVLRQNGFKEEIRKSGFEVKDLEESFLDVILENPDKAGIFCNSDATALYLSILLQRRGVIPGDQIKICGYDGQSFASFCTPPLPTIRQPMHEEGYLAVMKLLRMIDGENEKSEMLKPELIYQYERV